MARLDLDLDRRVTVTLSRRNLLALLHKLYWPGSEREIWNTDCYRDRKPVSDLLLILRCEEDEEHYARRTAPPGPMHPASEAFIEKLGETRW